MKLKLYNVNIGTLILRFHLFTALIVTVGFLGYLYIGIVVGMILFFLSIVGLEFRPQRTEPVYYRFPEAYKHVHIPIHRYNIWHQRHHWSSH
jgi:hypothetical protein